MSVKPIPTGQSHPVRQLWTAHEKLDALIARREDGRRSRLVEAEHRL